MTLNEYRAQCKEPGLFNFLCDALEIWQNDACIGYAIEAARQIDLAPQQIHDLVIALIDRMDATTTDEAAALYRNGNY